MGISAPAHPSATSIGRVSGLVTLCLELKTRKKHIYDTAIVIVYRWVCGRGGWRWGSGEVGGWMQGPLAHSSATIF